MSTNAVLALMGVTHTIAFGAVAAIAAYQDRWWIVGATCLVWLGTSGTKIRTTP